MPQKTNACVEFGHLLEAVANQHPTGMPPEDITKVASPIAIAITAIFT
jgi:hypothetical protein